MMSCNQMWVWCAIVFSFFASTSQQQIATKCFEIKDSICGPHFDGFSLLETDKLKNSQDLTLLIANLTNSSQLATVYQTNFGCLPDVSLHTSNLRYQTSFWCSRLVHDAFDSGCSLPAPKTLPKIARSYCQLAADSVSSFLLNPDVCPSNVATEILQDRAAIVKLLHQSCVDIGGLESESVLVPREEESCGFLPEVNATQKCMSERDACCRRLVAKSSMPSKSTKPPTAASPKDRKKATKELPLSSKNSSNGISTTAIIIIVVVSLVVILIIAFIIYRCTRRKKSKETVVEIGEKKKNETSSTPQEPYSLKSKDTRTVRIQEPDANSFIPAPIRESYQSAETFSTSQDESEYSSIPPNSPNPFTTNSSSPQIIRKNSQSNRFSKRFSSLYADADSSNSSGQITVMKVIQAYTTTQSDELPLSVGQHILVVKNYDDGWGLGINKTTGMQGVFPLVCVARLGDNLTQPPTIPTTSKSSRVNSGIFYGKRISSSIISKEDVMSLWKLQGSNVPRNSFLARVGSGIGISGLVGDVDAVEEVFHSMDEEDHLTDVDQNIKAKQESQKIEETPATPQKQLESIMAEAELTHQELQKSGSSSSNDIFYGIKYYSSENVPEYLSPPNLTQEQELIEPKSKRNAVYGIQYFSKTDDVPEFLLPPGIEVTRSSGADTTTDMESSKETLNAAQDYFDVNPDEHLPQNVFFGVSYIVKPTE